MPLFITQFCGAFNDNTFKNALTVLVGFQVAQDLFLPAEQLVPLAMGLFILPFFLFSATSGQLADKYDKAMLIRWVKLAEIVLMLLAAVGFMSNSLLLLFIVLFLMGAQSTVFGPLKYSILPQHLQTDELIAGNGLIEMGTFLSILLGTIAGGLLIEVEGMGTWLISIAIVAIAIAGWLSSRSIPEAPSSDPLLRVNWNFLTETFRVMHFAYQNRTVFIAILAISWFWFIGAVYLAQLLEFSKSVLHGSPMVYILFLTFFSVGIGGGSVACERLAHVLPKMRLVLIGSLGMSLFSILIKYASDAFLSLALPSTTPVDYLQCLPGWYILASILLVGLFGGLYIVPLYAHVQQQSEVSIMARVISANNILNALFMVVASVLVMLLSVPVTTLFLVVGILNLLVLGLMLLTDRHYRTGD